MVGRGSIVLGVAGLLGLVDLVHKAAVDSPAWAFHPRSGAWELLAAALIAGCVALARIPSISVAGAAALLAGGAAGNLSSSLRSERGIPNPIVVGEEAVVAFNLADVFTLAGIVALMTALIVVTIRHREQLLPPRAFARMLWRRLRSA